MIRLGTVCYLNARPLVVELEARDDVELVFDVPARLGGLLEAGRVDAALVPLADLIRNAGRWQVVSDACIASEAETLTVRVLARRPPHAIRRLAVDADSHTSVLLARLLWRRVFGQDLRLDVIDVAVADLESLEAVLLIGDKVVDPRRVSFAYEVDLGGAWRQHTGLPFVFAVWAVSRQTQTARIRRIDALLREARDAGLAQTGRIAEVEAAAHGWSCDLAHEYLTRRLSYTLDAKALEGAERFARLCVEEGLLDGPAALPWPERIAGSTTDADVVGAEGTSPRSP